MLSFINYYADGTSSKACRSRKLADMIAERVGKAECLSGDPRKFVWIIDHDHSGNIIRATAERIVQPWERKP